MNFFNVDALTIGKYMVYGCIVVLAWQTFNIQVLNREVYQAETKNMVTRTKNIYAERGQIMDRNGVVFADNLRDTSKVEDYSRIFLQGKLASQIVGKVGYDGVGNMGLEKVFDLRLRGNEGFRVSFQDARRNEIYGRSEDVAEAEPGKNLVLTIDRNLQEIVEKNLKMGTEEFEANSASAVVLDPFTGEILAMATYPTFDPNSKNQGVGRASKNDIVALSFEPGSTFKVITAAAALEYNVVSPNKIFSSEGGRWKWSEKSKEINDTHDYGEMNMHKAMVKSSNIVYAKIADEVGPERMCVMARHFGLGMKTSDYFYGEERGLVKDPHELRMDDRTLKTMGYGHAITVTPIQMAMVYAAIANGGNLMEPMIVKEWRDSEGNLIEKKKPVTIRRVVSESTAATIRRMLVDVVTDGTAKAAASKKLADVEVAGKTGTAEKFNKETKMYDKNLQAASFVGFVPAENPRYLCFVVVDEPRSKHVGGVTAGPIFRRIIEGIYFHPELSPKSYALANVEKKVSCKADFVGMMAGAAKSLAESKHCKVRFEGEGNRVVSERRDVGDSIDVMLMLGEMVADKMPDLKGLSLRDAMEIAGNFRMNVEYTGKGRVVAQSPKPEEVLRKGQICKLTLKEKG